MFRPYSHRDYETLCRWWLGWDWHPVPQSSLPPTGFVTDERAAGFLYKTDSTIAWVEWVVADPLASKEDRDQSVDALLEKLFDEARQFGFATIFTSSNKPSFLSRLERHGFLVGDRGVTQLFKRL